MFFPDFSILILTKKNKNKLDLKIEALIVGWVKKEKKRKEKNKLSSLTFIVEPELSHSFPTKTTLSVSRPKQNDHLKSRSTLLVSRPNSMAHKTNTSKTQQDPNSMTHKTHPTIQTPTIQENQPHSLSWFVLILTVPIWLKRWGCIFRWKWVLLLRWWRWTHWGRRRRLGLVSNWILLHLISTNWILRGLLLVWSIGLFVFGLCLVDWVR